MKVYIRSTGNISPQHSLDPEMFFSRKESYAGNLRHAVEPDYTGFVDSKMIRRMSRIVKMGVGAAVSCLRQVAMPIPEAIITGTAYGCLEDTDVFLRRMIENREELLTPTAFIQSTHNTVGAQIALLLKCHGYNNTIVHRGFSFENALLDASLLLKEGMDNILVGGIDEIIPDSHAIMSRFHLYRSGNSDPDFIEKSSKGTIPGEGAAFFLLSQKEAPENMAVITSQATLYKPGNINEVENRIRLLLDECNKRPDEISLLLSGHNGDAAHDEVDRYLSDGIFNDLPAFPFKALCGEYPTASAFACWLASLLIDKQKTPDWFVPVSLPLKNILIHNHDGNGHHSLILLSAC